MFLICHYQPKKDQEKLFSSSQTAVLEGGSGFGKCSNVNVCNLILKVSVPYLFLSRYVCQCLFFSKYVYQWFLIQKMCLLSVAVVTNYAVVAYGQGRCNKINFYLQHFKPFLVLNRVTVEQSVYFCILYMLYILVRWFGILCIFLHLDIPKIVFETTYGNHPTVFKLYSVYQNQLFLFS